MKMLGRDSGELRMPLVPLEGEGLQKLRQALVAYGLLPG